MRAATLLSLAVPSAGISLHEIMARHTTSAAFVRFFLYHVPISRQSMGQNTVLPNIIHQYFKPALYMQRRIPWASDATDSPPTFWSISASTRATRLR